MDIQEYSEKIEALEKAIYDTGDKYLILKYLNAITKLRYYLRQLEREIVEKHGAGKVMINQIVLDIFANRNSYDNELLEKCNTYDKGKILEKRMNKFLDLLNSPNISLSITEIKKGKEE